MNLIFRMFLTIFFAKRALPLNPLDISRVTMRVLPNDLDVQMHMNNGRFLSIMDLGRIDLMVRTGFWAVARKNGWFPLVGSVKIEYRRTLAVFEKFEMTSQIISWDDRWIFMEQHLISGGKLAAKATFKTMIRSKQGLITPTEVMRATGIELMSPALTHDAAALL